MQTSTAARRVDGASPLENDEFFGSLLDRGNWADVQRPAAASSHSASATNFDNAAANSPGPIDGVFDGIGTAT